MKETEIRPKELFQKYLELSLQDAEKISKKDLEKTNCPSCDNDSSENRDHLKKNGFNYKLCSVCGTLYCSPRPSRSALAEFYKTSISSDYWAKTFFPAVAEARREKLFRPKALNVLERVISKNKGIRKVCDVGAGYGIFLEELGRENPELEIFAIEPGNELAEVCRKKGIPVLQKNAEDSSEWNNKFDLVISSEVIEHVFSPEEFVKSLVSLTKEGGYVLLTGLGYEGFDTLTLQENSNSIFPPHHLNFLSVSGFEILFKKCGLTDIDITTPGELDLDIVINSNLPNEFVRVLKSRGIDAQKGFQEFLKKFKMSSHVWALGRKVEHK